MLTRICENLWERSALPCPLGIPITPAWTCPWVFPLGAHGPNHRSEQQTLRVQDSFLQHKPPLVLISLICHKSDKSAQSFLDYSALQSRKHNTHSPKLPQLFVSIVGNVLGEICELARSNTRNMWSALVMHASRAVEWQCAPSLLLPLCGIDLAGRCRPNKARRGHVPLLNMVEGQA